jgi:hypothetical protein
MSGPQAAEAKAETRKKTIPAQSSPHRPSDGAHEGVRTIAEVPVGVPLELTDPAEVVIS